jgi:hypothetical protein
VSPRADRRYRHDHKQRRTGSAGASSSLSRSPQVPPAEQVPPYVNPYTGINQPVVIPLLRVFSYGTPRQRRRAWSLVAAAVVLVAALVAVGIASG